MKLIENSEHGNISDEKIIQYKLKQEEAFRYCFSDFH